MIRRLGLLVVPLLLLLFSSGAMAADNSTLMVRQDAKLGAFLTDSKGMTLYLFKKDSPNTSNCYNGCAKAWPPFTASGTLTLPDGVSGTLTTITRTDGTTQVAYNGTPLYYYATDKAPGDTTGQGVGKVWFVMAPQLAAQKLPSTGGLPIGLALVGGLAAVGAGAALKLRSR